jgi:hypothetical protein
VGFLPPTGRIPPDSGGWHRGVLSRSVAGARTERPLLIRLQLTMCAVISARVRKYQSYCPEPESLSALCAQTSCDKSIACFNVGAFVMDLKPEIKKILDKHESSFNLKPPSLPNDEFEKGRKAREQDFYLMTVHLTEVYDSIDEDAIEELRRNIADKLALDSLQRVSRSEWWWSPPSDSVASTLREVQRALEKTEKKKTSDSLRKFRWIWWVLRELIYLAIVVSLFTAANSKFETVVVAALVLIYTSVASARTAILISFGYLAYTAELIYWEFGRKLRLKVPISRLTEAEKVVSDLSIPNLIHTISIGVGSLIALWHLVITLLK